MTNETTQTDEQTQIREKWEGVRNRIGNALVYSMEGWNILIDELCELDIRITAIGNLPETLTVRNVERPVSEFEGKTCPGCKMAIYDKAADDGWCTDCDPLGQRAERALGAWDTVCNEAVNADEIVDAGALLATLLDLAITNR